MLPININELLEKNRIESNRIEYKQGWNPTAIYHTICAFANDFENLGGGYIVVGVEEENGIAKRPVMGVPTEQLDKIQQQMVGFNNLFAPYYLPRVSVEEVDSKNVVVIWAPVGINRPFIETDEDRSYFLMYIPVHEGCGNVVTLKENTENYPNITPLLRKALWN